MENTSVRAAENRRKRRRPASKKKIFEISRIALATIIAASFAILFLTPIILTITNSFMSASEISAN